MLSNPRLCSTFASSVIGDTYVRFARVPLVAAACSEITIQYLIVLGCLLPVTLTTVSLLPAPFTSPSRIRRFWTLQLSLPVDKAVRTSTCTQISAPRTFLLFGIAPVNG